MRVPAAAANAGTVVLTMKQGAAIDGSVIGPDGQPVAGASVRDRTSARAPAS